MRGEIDLEGNFETMANALNCIEKFAFESLGRSAVASFFSGITKVRRSLKQQKEDIAAHYDLGNDFFSLWLDNTTLSYSCAYFRTPEDSLDIAQQQKADLVLKKICIEPGMSLLDIGCGWGWLSLQAAKKYGAKVSAITLSEEQYDTVQRRIETQNLQEHVKVRLCNYLDLDMGLSFDRIVSVGMFEHVDRTHHAEYFKTIHRLLKPGGLSLLHTLTKDQPVETDPWIKKYIFPGGDIPTIFEVVSHMPEHDFRLLHIESLRQHYVKTLGLWYDNFKKPEAQEKIRVMFDDKFIRMWSLYLLMAKAFLAIGEIDLHQFVFTKGTNNQLPLTLEHVYCG